MSATNRPAPQADRRSPCDNAPVHRGPGRLPLEADLAWRCALRAIPLSPKRLSVSGRAPATCGASSPTRLGRNPSAPSDLTLTAGMLTTLQASRHAADRPVAPPQRLLTRGFDPDVSNPSRQLLPGLLTATRTGPAPAIDAEHEQQITRPRGTSSSTGRRTTPCHRPRPVTRRGHRRCATRAGFVTFWYYTR